MGSCMILLQTLSFGPVHPLRSGEPTADGTGGSKRVRCPIIGSCIILLQTLSFGPVHPLRSGEPTADGTRGPKRVRCPIIGSCIILLQTLSFGDPLFWATDFGSGSVDLSDMDLWINQTRSKLKQSIIFQYLKSCQTDNWKSSYEKITFQNHL